MKTVTIDFFEYPDCEGCEAVNGPCQKKDLNDPCPVVTLSILDDDEVAVRRKDLEYMVAQCVGTGKISMSKGRCLLGFRYMEQMREWVNGYKDWPTDPLDEALNSGDGVYRP